MSSFSKRVVLAAFALLLTTTIAAPSVLAATKTLPGSTTPPKTATSPSGVGGVAVSGPFNMIITPVSQQLEVQQGGSVSTNIQIQNQGNSTEHIKAQIYTFNANGQDGTPRLIKPAATDDFINWAKLSKTQFDAEPNVWNSVTLTIDTPKSAAFGYYYAIIFSRADQNIVDKQANFLGAVTSLVLLNVQAPGATRKLNITEFSTSKKSMEFLPATFTVRMHNIGNTHVAPRGNIFIKKGSDNIAILEVNLAKGQILPNSYRVFEAKWSDGTPAYKQKIVNGTAALDKNGKPIIKLSWDKFSFDKLRFGRYTAKLVMVYNNGNGDIAENTELSFWVIPWRIIGFSLLGLIVVGAGLWSLLVRPLRNRMKPGRGSFINR